MAGLGPQSAGSGEAIGAPCSLRQVRSGCRLDHRSMAIRPIRSKRKCPKAGRSCLLSMRSTYLLRDGPQRSLVAVFHRSLANSRNKAMANGFLLSTVSVRLVPSWSAKVSRRLLPQSSAQSNQSSLVPAHRSHVRAQTKLRCPDERTRTPSPGNSAVPNHISPSGGAKPPERASVNRTFLFVPVMLSSRSERVPEPLPLPGPWCRTDARIQSGRRLLVPE